MNGCFISHLYMGFMLHDSQGPLTWTERFNGASNRLLVVNDAIASCHGGLRL